MHTDIETTIDLDTARLEDNLAALAELNNHKRAAPRADGGYVVPTVPTVRSKRRRAGKTPIVATRRPKPGRQVLIPGKRKAQRHPWADRLHAARNGGFVVDQTHPDTNLIVGTCYACGDRFGFIYGDEPMRAEFEARAKTHELSAFDGIRGCQRGVEL